MKELFDTIDTIVLWSIALSLLAPLVFVTLGWMKRNEVNKYFASLKGPYAWFAVYGLVRLCM